MWGEKKKDKKKKKMLKELTQVVIEPRTTVVLGVLTGVQKELESLVYPRPRIPIPELHSLYGNFLVQFLKKTA